MKVAFTKEALKQYESGISDGDEKALDRIDKLPESIAEDNYKHIFAWTNILAKTENTHAIHHFANTLVSTEERLKTRQRWEYFQSRISREEIDNAISLLHLPSVLNKGIDYISLEIARRIYLSETFNKNNFLEINNVFNEIYHRNYWGSAESRSGPGSELKSTEKLREFLPRIWKKYNIKTVLDAPCGDYNWMRAVDKTDIDYIGGDIVSDCVENNNKKYRDGKVAFKVIDITKDELPKVDMVFCRDCLQHLSNEDVWKALKNFKKSGSSWLLTTSYPLTMKNWDIQNGDYRPLNFLTVPFNFNNFFEKIHENICDGSEPDKMMFMYRLEDMKLEPPVPISRNSPVRMKKYDT